MMQMEMTDDPLRQPERSGESWGSYVVFFACVLVAVVVALFFLRSTPGAIGERTSCTVQDVSAPTYVEVCRPPWDAGLWEYFQTGRESCAGERLVDLAFELETNAEEQAVARAYSQWVGSLGGTDDELKLAVAHAGCLAGLREG